MNINIFSYVFAPEKFLINSLALKLAKSHNVDVSTGIPNYPSGNFFEGYGYLGPYTEKIDSVNIFRFPVIPRKKGTLFLILNYISNLGSGLFNIFRLGRSDCVFVFATSPIMTAIPAILYAKYRKVPVFIWLQDLWPDSFVAITGYSPYSIVSRVLGLVVRWVYKNTDVMLVQSEGFKDNLNKYGFKGDVHWVPNWANDSQCSVDPSWVQDIPKDRFVVTFAGNIGTAQKLDTLLDAAKELVKEESIFFAIVGDGREYTRLVREYSGLSNVKFYGRRAPEDMIPLFEASSALIVMLKNDPVFSLTIPSKLQSYLKARRPIICSLSGEGERLVRDNCLGVISKVEDPVDLAKNILKLSKETSVKRERMGENCYKLYKSHFEVSKVIARIESLLVEYTSK